MFLLHERKEKHFKKQMWPTQLRSIRSQVTKSTLDDKCEEYQKLTDDKKTELRDWKVIEWFRQSKSRVIKALRDHLLPKKERGGPKSVQLRVVISGPFIKNLLHNHFITEFL